MHEALRHDYSSGNGAYSSSCTRIALEIAEALKANEQSPKILALYGEELDDLGNRAVLVPVPYEGRVSWGAHIVCEAAGVVHDPMLSEPMPRAEYLATAFQQPVEVEDVSSHLAHRL